MICKNNSVLACSSSLVVISYSAEIILILPETLILGYFIAFDFCSFVIHKAAAFIHRYLSLDERALREILPDNSEGLYNQFFMEGNYFYHWAPNGFV